MIILWDTSLVSMPFITSHIYMPTTEKYFCVCIQEILSRQHDLNIFPGFTLTHVTLAAIYEKRRHVFYFLKMTEIGRPCS